MTNPKLLSFNKANAKIVDMPTIKLVKNKETRSKVTIIPDIVGENCIKTPKAIPQN